MAQMYSDEFKSGHIFSLASECGLDKIAPGNEVPDYVYNEFAYKYNYWRKSRDVALEQYLGERRGQFRAYLPMTPDAAQIASQVFWYYDEMITADPLADFVDAKYDEQRADRKSRLLHNFHVLQTIKRQVHDGMILLASPGPLPDIDEEVPELVARIATDPEVVTLFDEEARFGRDHVCEGAVSVTRHEIGLESVFRRTLKFELPPGQHSIPVMEVGVRLPEVSRGELSSDVVDELLSGLRQAYPREAMLVYRRLRAASRVNSGAFFRRRSSMMVANRIVESTQSYRIQYAPFELPFIHGVPPEALLELRAEIPDAFSEFRVRLSRLFQNAASEAHDRLKMRELIEYEVLPHVRKLSSELEGIARQSRIIGYSNAVAVGVGTLMAVATGSPLVGTLSVALPAMLPAVGAAANFSSRRSQLSSNPYYFLWRARELQP